MLLNQEKPYLEGYFGVGRKDYQRGTGFYDAYMQGKRDRREGKEIVVVPGPRGERLKRKIEQYRQREQQCKK